MAESRHLMGGCGGEPKRKEGHGLQPGLPDQWTSSPVSNRKFPVSSRKVAHLRDSFRMAYGSLCSDLTASGQPRNSGPRWPQARSCSDSFLPPKKASSAADKGAAIRTVLPLYWSRRFNSSHTETGDSAGSRNCAPQGRRVAAERRNTPLEPGSSASVSIRASPCAMSRSADMIPRRHFSPPCHPLGLRASARNRRRSRTVTMTATAPPFRIRETGSERPTYSSYKSRSQSHHNTLSSRRSSRILSSTRIRPTSSLSLPKNSNSTSAVSSGTFASSAALLGMPGSS